MKNSGRFSNPCNKILFIKLFLVTLIVLSICVIINTIILYKKIVTIYNAEPAYDYRINIFGNDGEFPKDIIDFASNLDDPAHFLTIEQTFLPFNSENYNVVSIALDTNTFMQLLATTPSSNKPYFVLSSLYSIDANFSDNISIYLGEDKIEISNFSNSKIPLGAMSNITIPTSLGPTLLLITTQETANELYELFPTNQQRQISIYYETTDGKILTKQMESFSPKQISNTQIWDVQDFSKNSLWAHSITFKRYIFIILLSLYTLTLETMIIFTAFTIKECYNYHSNNISQNNRRNL